jgi:hypothetical protein
MLQHPDCNSSNSQTFKFPGCLPGCNATNLSVHCTPPPMAAPSRTLLVLIGPPGAGKTTAAKQIMELREKQLRRPLQGQVLSVDHPDGERNKKGNGVKQVGAGVVLDGCGGLALLGRYASTHSAFWKTTQNKLMEGADRLAVGKEKGTWSQLLRPGVSPLADCRVLVVDSCDKATLHENHLTQARDAGWAVRVRELGVDRDTSRDRCMERNYAGRSSSIVQPRLTPMEREWNEAFDARVAQLRARFAAWDYALRSQDEVLQEASSLLQLGDEAAGAAATARATDPAAAPRVAAASQAAPAITLAGSADRTAARSAAGLARGPQKRAIAQAAAAPKPAKKRPKQQPQQARATTAAAAAAGDDSVLDHALREAQAAQFRIEVGASRWSLWNQVTGKRVGKIETQVGKIKISCTLRGSQWTESATTKPEATELMRRLTTAAT